jgi:hypothetical protein
LISVGLPGELTAEDAVVDEGLGMRVITRRQEKTEPPVYVSDRRLVKIVAMLRVIAYTCGRTQVNEYDCLMLQHVMWNRPEECEAIREWVLDRIAVDKGTNQVSYLLNGVFRRACQAQTADGQVPPLSIVHSMCPLLVQRRLSHGYVRRRFPPQFRGPPRTA